MKHFVYRASKTKMMLTIQRHTRYKYKLDEQTKINNALNRGDIEKYAKFVVGGNSARLII